MWFSLNDQSAPICRNRNGHFAPKVLLITNGTSGFKVGGSALRSDALEQALARTAEVYRLNAACPEIGNCEHAPASASDPYAQLFCPRMMANLTQAVHEQRPDLIVVSSLDLHRYLYELRAVTSSPLVLDMHNIESLLFRDISQDAMHRYESDGRRLDAYWRKVAAVEKDAVHFSHQIWTCSDRDAERLVELYDIPRSKIKTVPNAVSVKSVITASVPVRLLFPGRLDWYPNATAAELLIDQVAPLLTDRMPSFPLVLAGALPRPGSLTGRILNRQTPSNVRIVADPVDMSDLWPRAILIVPLRLGGGTRLKILQAFAAGSPVISTAKGIEGIAAEHGIHYVNAEEPAEMVNATCRLLDNRGLREEMVTEAHNLVARQYSVDALARLMRTILRENLRHDFR